MRPIPKCTDVYAANNLKPGSEGLVTLFFSTDDNCIKGVSSDGTITSTNSGKTAENNPITING